MTVNRAAVRAAYWLSRAGHTLQRAAHALETATTSAADALLSPETKRALTARIYDDLPAQRSELFAWELAWFEQDLPKPPARILVGGCGRGREVCALLARGYEVWAFDPSLDSVRECERAATGAAFIGWFDYEQLVQSFGDASSDHRTLLPRDVRFDAVLLGWGSLSHVLDEAQQAAMFRLFAELGPAAPILASFYLMPELHVRPPSRAEKLGSGLAALLGGRHASLARERVRLRGTTGFTYTFDDARLRALAAGCGREVVIYGEAGFPHATFKAPR